MCFSTLIFSVCVDCELRWNEFGTCTNGEMNRIQVIVTQQVGAGQPCPDIQTETLGKKFKRLTSKQT